MTPPMDALSVTDNDFATEPRPQSDYLKEWEDALLADLVEPNHIPDEHAKACLGPVSLVPQVDNSRIVDCTCDADPLEFVTASSVEDAVNRINNEFFWRRDNSEICRQNAATGEIQGDDGTIYRTEHELFSRIVSHGLLGSGPEWFEVNTKSGQTLLYGKSVESRRAVGKEGTVLSWSVNSVTDSFSNFYTVEYENNIQEGWQRPFRISFSGNKNAQITADHGVEFRYRPRSNYPVNFVSGERTVEKHLLDSALVISDGGVISTYRFTYENSPITNVERLRRVDLCTLENECLAPLDLTWQATELKATGAFTMADYPASGGTVDFGQCAQNKLLMIFDIDLDGRADLVCHVKSGFSLVTYVAANTISETNLPKFGDWRRLSPTKSPTPLLDNADCKDHLLNGDVNGDGLPDLICIRRSVPIFRPQNSLSYEKIFVALAYLDEDENERKSVAYENWTEWGDASVLRSANDPDGCKTVGLHDINGDGKADLICVSSGLLVTLFKSNGTKFELVQHELRKLDEPLKPPPQICRYIHLVDLNGDGVPDVVCANVTPPLGPPPFGPFPTTDDISVRIYEGGKYKPASLLSRGTNTALSRCTDLRTADVNGDGAADLLCIELISGNRIHVSAALNKGGSFEPWSDWLRPTETPFGVGVTQVQFLDINGDGRADLVLTHSTSNFNEAVNSFVSTGTSFLPKGQFLKIETADTQIKVDQIVPFQISGDKAVEFLVLSGESSRLRMYGVMGGPRHEVIAKIQNTATANDSVGEQQALGEFVEIEYGPLGMVVDELSLTMTDETLQPAPRLLYIVKIFRKINPSESFTTTQYTYSGFKYDFARRASVGFAQRAAEVLPQKLKTITAFEQKHPFVGLPKWSQERTNGKLLTFVANSWETKKYQKNWQYATDKSLLILDEDASSQDRDFLFQFEINSDVMPQMTLVGLPIEAVALRKLKNPDVDGISYFPYVAKSTTVTFFPEGDMRNTIVTNQEFDDFGNVLTVRRESEDGKTIKTANTYLLDLQHWVIGAMKSATTETTRGSEIIRRRVEFEIDAAGAISKEIIEPGKPEFSRDRIHTGLCR